MTRLPLGERAELLVRCLLLEQRLIEMQARYEEAEARADLWRRRFYAAHQRWNEARKARSERREA